MIDVDVIDVEKDDSVVEVIDLDSHYKKQPTIEIDLSQPEIKQPKIEFQNDSGRTLRKRLSRREDLSTKVGIVHSLNVILTIKELKTLLLPNWLSDEVINSYLVLLAGQFEHVYVLPSYWSYQLSSKGVHAIESWPSTAQFKEVVNFETHTVVLLPVNMSSLHWVLCCFFPSRRMWAILDSAGNYNSIRSSIFFHEMDLFIKVYLHSGNQEAGASWTFKFPISSSNKHQNFKNDSHNCGVYCCYYARELSTGVELANIAKQDVPTKDLISSFRDNMLDELVKGIPLTGI